MAVNEEATENVDTTTIQDEDTALAAMAQVEEGTKHTFWWWILLIIATITGKTAYDKKHKKGIFAEKETIEGKDDSKK